ncbi:MAG: protein kinase [Myxococcota bacterium]
MPAELDEPTQLGTNPALGYVGDYALLNTLGQGGMGRIYLARHRSSGELFALKRPHPDQRKDEMIRARFKREVEIGLRFVHPALPRVVDSDLDGDWQFAVFELVPGLNLSQLSQLLSAKERLLPYPVTLTILCRLLEALDAAHRVDIVHRDISRRNVMASFDGTVRLIDFGAAKASFDEYRTRPGTAVGSVRYSSPEYFRGETVGPLADVYAVAVVGYELLTGTPVVGRVQNILQAARIVAEETPAPMNALNPEIPEAISEAFRAALAKDPGARPRSAQAFATALAEARPEWCGLDPARLRSFLEAWFPAEAASLRRLIAERREAEVEESPALTVLASTFVEPERPIVMARDFESRVEASAGIRFPAVPGRAAEPPRPTRTRALIFAVAAAAMAVIAALVAKVPGRVTSVQNPDVVAPVAVARPAIAALALSSSSSASGVSALRSAPPGPSREPAIAVVSDLPKGAAVPSGTGGPTLAAPRPRGAIQPGASPSPAPRGAESPDQTEAESLLSAARGLDDSKADDIERIRLRAEALSGHLPDSPRRRVRGLLEQVRQTGSTATLVAALRLLRENAAQEAHP